MKLNDVVASVDISLVFDSRFRKRGVEPFIVQKKTESRQLGI